MNDLQTFQTMIRFQNHEITRLKRKGERSSNHTKKNHKMQKSIQKKIHIGDKQLRSWDRVLILHQQRHLYYFNTHFILYQLCVAHRISRFKSLVYFPERLRTEHYSYTRRMIHTFLFARVNCMGFTWVRLKCFSKKPIRFCLKLCEKMSGKSTRRHCNEPRLFTYTNGAVWEAAVLGFVGVQGLI